MILAFILDCDPRGKAKSKAWRLGRVRFDPAVRLRIADCVQL